MRSENRRFDAQPFGLHRWRALPVIDRGDSRQRQDLRMRCLELAAFSLVVGARVQLEPQRVADIVLRPEKAHGQ